MTLGSVYGLTTQRVTDWRDSAACCGEDADLFFAGDSTSSGRYDTEQAKAICRRCPSIEHCLQWALDRGEDYGVFGGLTDAERRAIRRRRAANVISIDDYTDTPKTPAGPRTLQQVWDEHARVDGEHVLWTGPKVIHQPEGNVTPNQAAFRLDRGRLPDGPVLRTCNVSSCVRPAHLEDNPERQRCGTRAGYDRHRRDGEVACADCRRANADADNRLRRTGTTRAAV